MDVNDMEYRMSSDLPMMQSNSPPQARQGCPFFNAEPLPSFSHPHNNPNGRQQFAHYYHSFNPGPPSYYESYHPLVRSHPPLPTPTPPAPRRGPIPPESYVYRTWYHQHHGTMPPTTPPAPALGSGTGTGTGSGASPGDDGGRVAAGTVGPAGPAARYAGGEGSVSGLGASGAAPAAAPGTDSTRPEGADGNSTSISTSTNTAHAAGFQSILAQPGGPTQASTGGGGTNGANGANGQHQGGFGPYDTSVFGRPYHSPYNIIPRPSVPPMYTGAYTQLQNSPQGLTSSTASVDRPQLQPLSSRGPSLPALNPPFHTHSHNSHSLTQPPAPPMATEPAPSAEPNAGNDTLDYRHGFPVEPRRRLLSGRHSVPTATASSIAEASQMARPRARHATLYQHQHDYDNDEDMFDIGEMMADEEENMFMGAASPADAGGLRAPRSEEDRVRQHQLLRGQMLTRRVASKQAISQLQAVDIASLEESEKTCVICYNDFGIANPEGIQEAPLRLPKCQHIFGENCIKKWFEESDSCPYCRGKVPSETITVTTPAAREFLQRQYGIGRQLPQVLRQGASPPIQSHSGGDIPSRRQSGDRRSPPSPSDPEMRRRTRARHHSGRLSMSLATPHAPPAAQTGPLQSAPWMNSPASYARHSLSPTRNSQRNQYGPNTTNSPFFTGIPPMHLPTGMGSGAGPSLQAGAAAYGYHGQLNSGDDARHQANPGLPYPQIPPVAPVEGGQPALGDSWTQ